MNRAALTLALLCAAGVAQSQPVPSPDDAAAAAPDASLATQTAELACVAQLRDEVVRAGQLYAARRYTDAALSLEPIVQGCPMPAAMLFLGASWRALGRTQDAVAMLERYLGVAAPADAADVRRDIDEMRASLVSLSLQVTPPEASVIVDGRIYGLRDAPRWLDPTPHVLEVRAPGYAPWRRELPAQRGGRAVFAVDLSLSDQVGRLIVEASVPTASVSINGAFVGAGRFEGELPPGPCLVEVRAPGYEPWRRSVRVDRGGRARVDVVLARPTVVVTRTSWTLPALIAGGALLALGALLTTLWLTRGTEEVPGDVTYIPAR